MREGVDLKERVSVLQTTLHAKKTETEASQEKLRETQMELTEYKEIAEQACSENVLLKNQVQHQCVCYVHAVCWVSLYHDGWLVWLQGLLWS